VLQLLHVKAVCVSNNNVTLQQAVGMKYLAYATVPSSDCCEELTRSRFALSGMPGDLQKQLFKINSAPSTDSVTSPVRVKVPTKSQEGIQQHSSVLTRHLHLQQIQQNKDSQHVVGISKQSKHKTTVLPTHQQHHSTRCTYMTWYFATGIQQSL